MRATHLTVAVQNPADPTGFRKGFFLVDTGATDSPVPSQSLESIGLVPEGHRLYQLADGTELLTGVAVGRPKRLTPQPDHKRLPPVRLRGLRLREEPIQDTEDA